METITVNSVIALFPETKDQISTFVSKIEESALNGDENPLYLYKQAVNMESIGKKLKDSLILKETALKEAEKYNKEELKDIYNSKIEVCELGTKWNYTDCGHSEYNRICSEIEELTERKKSFEKYLQTLKVGEQYIDPTTGEMVELNKAIKTSTTGLKITLNK